MKVENQVVSLDLAMRLKELGVKQDSVFRWTETHIPRVDWTVRYNPDGLFQSLAAFTVAELGEMLNRACAVDFDDSVMQSLGSANGFMVWLADINHHDFPTIDSWIE